MNKLLFLFLILISGITKAETTVLYFTADYCHNCPTFKQALYDPENIKLIRNYDKAYLIKYEQMGEEKWNKWTKKYGVTAIPTLVIIDTDKKTEKNPEGILTKQVGLDRMKRNGVLIDNTKQTIMDKLRQFMPIRKMLFRRN